MDRQFTQNIDHEIEVTERKLEALYTLRETETGQSRSTSFSSQGIRRFKSNQSEEVDEGSQSSRFGQVSRSRRQQAMGSSDVVTDEELFDVLENAQTNTDGTIDLRTKEGRMLMDAGWTDENGNVKPEIEEQLHATSGGGGRLGNTRSYSTRGNSGRR